MRELSRHIGDNTDVPAGDIGVGGREIGFLFGAYKQYRNEWAGILTGKGSDWGGSHIRPEATGYGLVYYVQQMIAQAEDVPVLETFKGRTVAISGSGNVAQFAALKVIELGGIVVSLSDSKGLLTSKAGFKPEDVHKIASMKLRRQSGALATSGLMSVSDGYLKDAKLSACEYVDGARPWAKFDKLDIALPCATRQLQLLAVHQADSGLRERGQRRRGRRLDQGWLQIRRRGLQYGQHPRGH
jgi:glutamate dehydrogenase (NADP+)